MSVTGAIFISTFILIYDSTTSSILPGVPTYLAPLPTNLEPNDWYVMPPLETNTHMAPTPPLSNGPPMASLYPSEDRLTDEPEISLLPIFDKKNVQKDERHYLFS